MNFFTATFLLLIIISVSSCQKELDIDPNNPPPPVSTNDSIYLSKFIALDTTLPSGQDTLYIMEFFYDNNKRLTRSTGAENDPPAFDAWEDKYFYTGNDTLPYMVIENSTYQGSPYIVDTVLYTYTNGIVSRDTSNSYFVNNGARFDQSGFRYTKSGNSVAIKGTYTFYVYGPPPDVTQYSGTASLVYSGENIIQQTTTPGTLAYDYMQATYDNEVNPLYRFDVHYPLLGAGRINFDAQKNNEVSSDLGDSPTSLYWKYRTSYVYRLDGYPLISRTIDLLDPGHHEKGLFFYTK